MNKEVLIYWMIGIVFFGCIYCDIPSQASTATAQLRILIRVQPMCPVDGVLVPVNSKKDCLDLQSGKLKYYKETFNRDGTKVITY